MTLCKSLEVHDNTAQASAASLGQTQAWPPESLVFALQGANLLRHFREIYGCKFCMAFIFQLAAVACFTLLERMDYALPAHIFAQIGGSPATFQDAASAFREAYRCLLGIGTRVMIARGVARMIFQTLRLMKVTLPSAARLMLEIVAEAAWRPQDVGHFSSVFPNYAMIGNDTDGGTQSRMEDLLIKWEA